MLQSVLDVTHIIGCDRFVSYKKDEAIEHTVPRLMPYTLLASKLQVKFGVLNRVTGAEN